MAVENVFGSGAPSVFDFDDWGTTLSTGMTVVFAVDGNVLGARVYTAAGQGGGAGFYTARFYQCIGSDSAGVGSGSLLASKDFGVVAASAWTEVLFDTPVPVTAGVPYKIVQGNDHWYTMGKDLFDTDRVSGNITAPATNSVIGGFTLRNGTLVNGNKTIYPTAATAFGVTDGDLLSYVDVMFEAGASTTEVSTSFAIVYDVATSNEILQEASNFFLLPA